MTGAASSYGASPNVRCSSTAGSLCSCRMCSPITKRWSSCDRAGARILLAMRSARWCCIRTAGSSPHSGIGAGPCQRRTRTRSSCGGRHGESVAARPAGPRRTRGIGGVANAGLRQRPLLAPRDRTRRRRSWDRAPRDVLVDGRRTSGPRRSVAWRDRAVGGLRDRLVGGGHHASRRRGPRRRQYAALAVACALATFVTPAGLGTWTSSGGHFLAPPRFVQEEGTPDVATLPGALFSVALLATLGSALLAPRARRRDVLFDIAMLVPVAFVSLTATRHLVFFPIAAAPFLSKRGPDAVAAAWGRGQGAGVDARRTRGLAAQRESTVHTSQRETM